MYEYIHVFIYLFYMKITLGMCIYIHSYMFIYLFPIKSTVSAHQVFYFLPLILPRGKATSEAAWEVGHCGRPWADLGESLKRQGTASILATSAGQEGSR